MNKNPFIVILGADGLVGRTVFFFLLKKFPSSVYGTVRAKRPKIASLLRFNATYVEKDLASIKRSIKKIDWVINCIGLFSEYSIKDLVYVNSVFPRILDRLSKEKKFKLIHISSDDVFSPIAGVVNEKSLLLPQTLYGTSKLLGETQSKTAITVRSSFLGLHPRKTAGLLEWARKTSKRKLNGYTNQIWTGCTTLQFANFCLYLVSGKKFEQLRRKSHVVHFTPLGPITKYNIIKECVKIFRLKKTLVRKRGEQRSRILVSKYIDLKQQGAYTNSVREALNELLLFEQSL